MTSSESLPRYVPLEHIMEELSISYSQALALALARSGQLPAIKVGGRGVWRVSLDAFEDYIAERYAETAAMVAETHS
ncbi:helix-turn-helix domain-containing protein [Brachybacterium sp. Marseille-Q7125]|uniref:helix-turn-helix domain-containing protein n=1 Tax=Brachybacterium sp. Marseille-Q7125 TaxID=2932815 RepID=UPI001FF2F481|nr:helix-turn-helix domain-containing protein [Brachybacterium sp. Marseille-Q7125]